MNAGYARFVSLVLALACTLNGTRPARSQVVHSESINANLSAVAPGNVFEQYYPNAISLNHPKRLSFAGTVTNIDVVDFTTVFLWFDWIDPRDPLGAPPRLSSIFPFDLAPGSSRLFGIGGQPAIMSTIDICPPQVSIHIHNNGPGVPVRVIGTFTHECPVPEPSAFAIGAISLVGFLFARRWI
jgi:hypothetical protein